MTWLDGLFSTDRRSVSHARGLILESRYDEALTALGDLETEPAQLARDEAREAAARRYLAGALEACRAGNGDAMRQLIARAQRDRTDRLAPLFHDTERARRGTRIRHAIAEHWVALLDAADYQRDNHYHSAGRHIPRYRVFASPRLVRAAHTLWHPEDGSYEISVAEVEAADRGRLLELSRLVTDQYPDDLAATLPDLGQEFVRAVLFVALARPDLAALPLVELPESDPMVCFERARIAHMLGQPDTALLALQGFVTLIGGHRTIRRLNSGVFMAQMAMALGDLGRAIQAMEAIPVRFLGKRPVALYARLLVDIGRLGDARDLLEDHLSRTSENHDAVAILYEVRQRLIASDFQGKPEITAEHLLGQGPMFNDEDR